MEKRNIWKNVIQPLEMHKDDRGRIVDVFYKESINHVAIITSKEGTQRGDHFHKYTTQHMLITKGTLEYWFKPLDSDSSIECELLREGDLVSTPPGEIHALKIIEDNEFIVFTEGLRGGKDYETDTYRVNPSIITERTQKQ